MLQKARNLRHLWIEFLLIIIYLNAVNAQFGEIASVITGLLGSGAGGAGLSGLTGSGAGLAGLGSAAGSSANLASLGSAAGGAGGALGGIGQLYQLAQAALQLTGTGVGIANQASESSWFPVESAARMNRDFQDRLIKNGGIVPHSLPGLGTATTKELKIGTEYGKNFESGETDSEFEITTSIPSSILPSSRDKNIGSIAPGLVTLLPGESNSATSDIERSRTTSNVLETIINSKISSSSLNKSKNSEEPTITVELPNKKMDIGEPLIIDEYDNQREHTIIKEKANITSTEIFTTSELSSTIKNNTKKEPYLPQMVPKLKKLLEALKTSNLSQHEFIEIAKQLEENESFSNPRVNSEQPPKYFTASTAPPEGYIPNEKKDKSISRNLAALNSALNDRIIQRIQQNQHEDSPSPIQQPLESQRTWSVMSPISSKESDNINKHQNVSRARERLHAAVNNQIPQPKQILWNDNENYLTHNKNQVSELLTNIKKPNDKQPNLVVNNTSHNLDTNPYISNKVSYQVNLRNFLKNRITNHIVSQPKNIPLVVYPTILSENEISTTMSPAQQYQITNEQFHYQQAYQRYLVRPIFRNIYF